MTEIEKEDVVAVEVQFLQENVGGEVEAGWQSTSIRTAVFSLCHFDEIYFYTRFIEVENEKLERGDVTESAVRENGQDLVRKTVREKMDLKNALMEWMLEKWTIEENVKEGEAAAGKGIYHRECPLNVVMVVVLMALTFFFFRDRKRNRRSRSRSRDRERKRRDRDRDRGDRDSRRERDRDNYIDKQVPPITIKQEVVDPSYGNGMSGEYPDNSADSYGYSGDQYDDFDRSDGNVGGDSALVGNQYNSYYSGITIKTEPPD